MTPLGVEVRTRTTRVARGIPVDTSQFFVAGPAISGSTTVPKKLKSLSDFIVEYGPRQAGNQAFYDTVDNAFSEGVREIWAAGFSGVTYAPGLALFSPDLGPGQVAVVGVVPDVGLYTAVLAHAKANNRHALLQVASGDNVAAMTTKAGQVRGLADVEYGALFGPWVNIPAPSGVVGGSARLVPGVGTVAGLIARADALGNVNRAAAGRDFPLQYATGFETTLTKADREALLNAGMNPFATIYGVLELYGFQTAMAQTTETPYWQANCSRTRMYLQAKAAEVGEPYVFKTIDGRGRLAGALKGDIDNVCLQLYQVDGLFGDTPQDAWATEVGASINTIQSIAQGELHAVVEARLSLHAKAVIIDLVTIPVTGQVSQPS